jgi:galactokinase
MSDAATDFLSAFDRRPEVVAEAHGRVNLIGEHTDYSGGYVLPMAIPQRTRVELARRADATVRVVSEQLGSAPVSFEVGAEHRQDRWIDYVQAVVVALRDEGFAVSGFDARISSDVPIGSGVSSSAALEVSLLRALRQAFALPLDAISLATLARRAENEFVGAPTGIMDPMAVSLASETAALFLDTRSLAYEVVPLPGDVEVVVVDSGVPHDHAAGEYRTRRAECERAARALGVRELRDVTDVAAVAGLSPPLDRRARHVVSENARVLAAVEAMRGGDSARVGALFDASHGSLRNDFEVSTPDVDRLVAIMRADAEALGARMTGGGFGGAIVALARRGHGAAAAERTRAAYDSTGAPRARVLVPVPGTVSVASPLRRRSRSRTT